MHPQPVDFFRLNDLSCEDVNYIASSQPKSFSLKKFTGGGCNVTKLQSKFQYLSHISDFVAVIDIPCYFRLKSRGSIFGQNNMVCLWQLINLTKIGCYNIDFLKVWTTSSEFLQRKSIFFAGPLNFLNKPLFWLCVTDYKYDNAKGWILC